LPAYVQLGVALISEVFSIGLLKRLRDDMLHVRLHKGLKLMESIS
jgi:hypothetical protein